MLKTATNPLGTPIEVFGQLRAVVQADRLAFWKDLCFEPVGQHVE